MIQFKTRLEAILTEALEVSSGYPNAPIVGRADALREQIDTFAPTLMFYGHYNAGKSSLINALLSEDGSEIAPTADKPCTADVNTYELGDYTIMDTPGIDAPAEHERVARSQLERTHVVVFVTDTGGATDEAATIEALVEIWKMGKPLIVALNDKTNLGRDSDLVARQTQLLFSKLAERADTHGILDDVDVVWVHALRGIKSKKLRVEGATNKADRFWENSGLAELRDLMMCALERTRGAELTRPAMQMLTRELDATIEHIEALSLSEDDASLFKTLKERVREARQMFLVRYGNTLRSLENELRDDLEAALSSGASDFSGFFEAFQTEVSKTLKAELTNSQNTLSDLLASYSRGNTNVVIDVETGEVVEGGSRLDYGQVANEAAKTFGNYVKGEGGQKAITEILLKLRSMKVPGLKGRWKRTLGRWAGNIGKGLGTGIQVFSTLYEIKSAIDKHEEFVTSQETSARLRRSTSKKLARQASGQVERSLSSISDDFFDPYHEHLSKSLDTSRATTREANEAKRKLVALRDEVSKLEQAF